MQNELYYLSRMTGEVPMRPTRRLTLILVTAGIIIGLLVITLIVLLLARPGSSQPKAAHGAPYNIALSNSFIGNTWRVEMENEFKGACAMCLSPSVKFSPPPPPKYL